MAEPLGLRALPRRAPTLPRPLKLEVPRRVEEWARHEPGGREWLERLPRLVADCVEQWSLTLGDTYDDTRHAFVARVERADRTPAVLKLPWPHVEAEHEPDALAFWDGGGAVRLYERDRERWALLVERCEPGTQLWALPEREALSTAAEVLTKLWRVPPPAHPFRTIDEEAPAWAELLERRWRAYGAPVERRVLDAALAALRELPPTQGERVVCSEDFHGGNVLLSERGWLAIDPKPLVAEPEFSVVSYVRDRRPVDARTMRRRLDAFVELGLDRERMRRWSVAHALWWGIEETSVYSENVDAARLLTNS